MESALGLVPVLLVGVPLLYYGRAALKGNLFDASFPFEGWVDVIPALAFMLVLGPIEEFGWRGYASPLLQRLYATMWPGRHGDLSLWRRDALLQPD